MGILADAVAMLFETFGVFVFPAAVFTVGVGLYLLLWWIASVSRAETPGHE